MYYVYVLEIKRDSKQSMYTGYCSDLKERISGHLKGNTQTTKNSLTIKLVYYEACLNKTDAIKRERQLKTGFGRGYLKRRLENYFETAGLV